MLVKRLMNQSGFTTVTLMGVLLVGGLLVMASFAAVDPDISQSRDDRDTKQAYAAAESGLQWYMNAARARQRLLPQVRQPARAERDRGRSREPAVHERHLQVAQHPERGVQVRDRADSRPRLLRLLDDRPVLDDRLRGQPAAAHHRTLARRDADDHRDAAAPELPRLHLLHPLRDARPGRVLRPGTRRRPTAPSTARCAPATASRSSSTTTTTCSAPSTRTTTSWSAAPPSSARTRATGSRSTGPRLGARRRLRGEPERASARSSIRPASWRMPPSNQELRNIALPAYRFTGKTKINLNGTNMVVTNANLVRRPADHEPALERRHLRRQHRPARAVRPHARLHARARLRQRLRPWHLRQQPDNRRRQRHHHRRRPDPRERRAAAGSGRQQLRARLPPLSAAAPTARLDLGHHDQAAILALNHSFIVDNWGCGTRSGR